MLQPASVASSARASTTTSLGNMLEPAPVDSSARASTTTSLGNILEWKQALKHIEPANTTFRVAPSDTTARLMSQFQVCGRCRGEIKHVGPGVEICPGSFEGAGYMLFYGAGAWTDVGEGLLDHWSGPASVHDCFADISSQLPARVQFQNTCFYEQKVQPFPPDVGRLTEKASRNNKVKVIGVFNLESVEWQLLHEATRLDAYQMLIIKFYWLEDQAKHLLYLQVLEKLLGTFVLISATASACYGRWQMAEDLVMPRVLWATFLRKDAAQNVSCNTPMPMSRECNGGSAVANFKLLPGEGLGEPEDLLFDVFGQSYHPEDPKDVEYIIPYKQVSLDLLSAFRICHTCQSGLLRIGPNVDGGYLVCEHAAVNSTAAISIGIRGFDPFGSELSERFGVKVEGFDCTGNAYSCPTELKKCRFDFHPFCVGKPFGNMDPGSFMTITEILGRFTKPFEEPILKIDCEGCEWSVLPEFSLEVLQRFPMIIMEAHWLEKQERHPRYLETMRTLLQVFVLVHSHACNVFGVWTINGTNFGLPRIVELTFVRKDYALAAPCENSIYREGMDIRIARMFDELKAEAFRLPPAAV
eukprot:s826_g3.t1